MKRIILVGWVMISLCLSGGLYAQQKEKEASASWYEWIFGTTEEQKPQGTYLGRLSTNPYQPDSVSNPYGIYGSPYSSKSVNNSFGRYGSRFSSEGANNPYTTDGPDIIGEDGVYLGKLNRNRYDPNSVSNPYGVYGSPFSPKSINNPYSTCGSPYSPYSARNPYATQAPKLYDLDRSNGSTKSFYTWDDPE